MGITSDIKEVKEYNEQINKKSLQSQVSADRNVQRRKGI